MKKLLIDREEAIKTAVEHYKGVTQFDALDLVEAMEALPIVPTTKAYHCKLEYDNGAKVQIVEMIVVAENEFKASRICEDKLCKHHDESIRSGCFNEITLSNGSAFIIGKI